ncbi:MAG TPA: PAS domain S-box protein [Solirubrobacteraceae bacterium]|nr:PAS domain S-box protein [Solirubrobacteraceae bacterium]
MSHEGQQISARPIGTHDIEQVLLGLADGSYVLSTPEGAVAECGSGVAALLGVSPERLSGRSTADALVLGADAESRAAFDALLQSDGGGDASRVFRATTPSGVRRALQFVVVAVPLALGWEFTSLLSELRQRDAGTWHPEALRLRHGRALAAIEGVCETGAQPDPGARLAGILIVVRDVDAPPLTREDVGRRMAEHRESARAAAAEAARRADAATGRQAIATDPSVEAAGLEDVIEAARVMRERLAESEREAEEAQAEAARMQAEVATVRAELRQALGDSALTRGQIAAMQAELESAAAAVEAAQRERELAQGDELVAAHAERDALRSELASALEQDAASRAELEQLRGELQNARSELDGTRGELDVVLAAAQDAQAEREQARLRAEALAEKAEVARAAAEAIRAEFSIERPAAAAAAPASGTLEIPPAGPGQAIALIGLDGTFKRLDDAFCSLLGCREEDLRNARWPSIIDRENLAAHQEIARALRAGEIQSAPVETVYMHAQGLLVPVAGTVMMHRAGGGGEPTHFLFRADVSRTSGAPS